VDGARPAEQGSEQGSGQRVTPAELASLRDRVARARLAANAPPVVPPRVRGDTPPRYETDEERLEARQRTWRESKRRSRIVCPECEGAKDSVVPVCPECARRRGREVIVEANA